MPKKFFYAVAKGRDPGIYRDWPSAEAQVKGFRQARCKKFPTRAGAETFMLANSETPEELWAAPGPAAYEAVDAGRKRASATAEDDTSGRGRKRVRTLDASLGLKDPSSGDAWGSAAPPAAGDVPYEPQHGFAELFEARDQVDDVCAAAPEAAPPVFRMWCDGGSRGNPGLSGAGGIIDFPDGRHLLTYGFYVGPRNTNNEAEYHSLIEGAKWAREMGVPTLDIFMDSKLVVKQVNNQWQVKNQRLQVLHRDACAVLASFRQAPVLAHVRREHNKQADAAANLSMDHQEDFLDFLDGPVVIEQWPVPPQLQPFSEAAAQADSAILEGASGAAHAWEAADPVYEVSQAVENGAEYGQYHPHAEHGQYSYAGDASYSERSASPEIFYVD